MEELGKINVAGMVFALRTFRSNNDRQVFRKGGKLERAEAMVDHANHLITVERDNFAQNLAAAYDAIWSHRGKLRRITTHVS